jgi:proline iminopeptidase
MGALVSVNPNTRPELRRLQPDFQLAFARIVTHYFRHHAWLEAAGLIDVTRVRELGDGSPGLITARKPGV